MLITHIPKTSIVEAEPCTVQHIHDNRLTWRQRRKATDPDPGDDRI